METSTYFYVGYLALWLVPLLYIFYLARKIVSVEKKLHETLRRFQ